MPCAVCNRKVRWWQFSVCYLVHGKVRWVHKDCDCPDLADPDSDFWILEPDPDLARSRRWRCALSRIAQARRRRRLRLVQGTRKGGPPGPPLPPAA